MKAGDDIFTVLFKEHLEDFAYAVMFFWDILSIASKEALKSDQMMSLKP